MNLQIKSIDPLSAGVVMGCVYALLGFLAGALLTVMALVGIGMNGRGDAGAAVFGLGAVIIVPILYGVLGFIGGLIGALFYNLVAMLTGGLRFTCEESHRIG